MQELNSNTQAILLLTSHLSKKSENSCQPLSPQEWGVFAKWLHSNNLTPKALLEPDVHETLAQWSDTNITLDRLITLLNRGTTLALSVEKWNRSGIWIISRSDKEYPKSFKERLKHLAPPVLFGIGNKCLLSKQAIAVTGSKKPSSQSSNNAHLLGAKVAQDGYTLITRANPVIDKSAMKGALEAGGSAVGVLSEQLIKAAISAEFRNALMMNELVLISPFYPESPYFVGHDKVCYTYLLALAEMGFVISPDISNIAAEALSNAWLPLYVDISEENKERATLLDTGTHPIDLNDVNSLHLTKLISKTEVHHAIAKNTSATLFDTLPLMPASTIESVPKRDQENEQKKSNNPFFELFIELLRSEIGVSNTFRPKELEGLFDLKGIQVSEWLVKAEDEKIIERMKGRVKKYKVLS